MDEVRRRLAIALLGIDPANQVPGMGSQANAGGFTSGQMRDRSEDMLAKDYFGFVPGHGPMPQGMQGTPSGAAPQRGPLNNELLRLLLQGN